MNSNNPYTAPQAAVDDALAPPRKPVAMLLFQVLLALVFLYALMELGHTAWGIIQITRVAEIGIHRQMWTWIVSHIVIGGGSLWLLVALQRRRPVSRWLAVVWVALLITGIVAIGPPMPEADGRPAVVAGYFIAISFMSLPFVLLAYFTAFSRRARAYFARNPVAPARS